MNPKIIMQLVIVSWLIFLGLDLTLPLPEAPDQPQYDVTWPVYEPSSPVEPEIVPTEQPYEPIEFLEPIQDAPGIEPNQEYI